MRSNLCKIPGSAADDQFTEFCSKICVQPAVKNWVVACWTHSNSVAHEEGEIIVAPAFWISKVKVGNIKIIIAPAFFI